MTLAQRFADALAAESAADGGAPELLPVRLARAGARVLPVAGLGISVQSGPHGRSPLGGSDPVAELAEQLQFTVGDGPCLAAFESGQPVFAVPEDLTHRWPSFAAELTTRTPFRGVVALPFRRALAGVGALDLFVTDPADVPRVDVFDAFAVADLITSALSEAAVWSTWSEASGPDWLRSPTAVRRTGVWQALGALGLALSADLPTALTVLRAHATATGRTVDDVAGDLLTGRLTPADLASTRS
ncbi:GAF domain-containing protein [Modestobacter sp. NPDC049651]|uniref:GAF domain-containing protein n=1 Tax=unclassified Modestobacter TaxID=2643866 RepID=UPI0033FDF1CD